MPISESHSVREMENEEGVNENEENERL